MNIIPLQVSYNSTVKVRLRRLIVLRRGALEHTDNVSQEELAGFFICRDVHCI